MNNTTHLDSRRTVLLQRIDPSSRAYRWYHLTLENSGDLFKTPSVVIKRGRIGQNGETIVRSFESADAASQYFETKLEQRLKRGYLQVDALDSLVEKTCSLCELLSARADETRMIFEFTNSVLFLNRDQTYLGRSMLVFKKHIPDFFRLAPSELLAALSEIRTSEEALRMAFEPVLMNYLFMGNRAGHVHLHLVPRYVTDPNFGDSPFLETKRTMIPQLPDTEYKQLATRIRESLLGQKLSRKDNPKK